MTTAPRPVSGDHTDTRIAAVEQRAHAAEALVERMARAIYEKATEATPFAGDWEDIGDPRRELYRRLAAAALRVVTERADGGAS